MFSTTHAFEIGIFDGCDGEKYENLQVLMLFRSTSEQRLRRLMFAITFKFQFFSEVS